MRPLTGPARKQLLAELRAARLAAQKDAEAFDQILFLVERIGCYLLGRAATLGKYKPVLLQLAAGSSLGGTLPDEQAVWHSTKQEVFSLTSEGRNDAMHQGARARHLTEHAIEFALLLEDALMNGVEPMTTIGDIMVRSPVTADLWQPVSYVRQVMLTNSYSILPVEHDGRWKFLTDASVASFLRRGTPARDERHRRLGLTVNEAHGEGLGFSDAEWARPSDPISSITQTPLIGPVLVCVPDPEKDDPTKRRLVGILTAYDLL